MVNLEALKQYVEDSGISITALAEKCGITRETYYNKISGKSEFKASEIISFSQALRMTREERDSIFFDV